MNALLAISPIDGRYADKTHALQDYFSEFALFKYRVMVEVLYFRRLIETLHPAFGLTAEEDQLLNALYQDFSLEDALRIKEIERTTNHDVKAVEYFLKQAIQGTRLETHTELIHFGLTSQDINNTAIPKSLLDACEKVLFPALDRVEASIIGLAARYMAVPMLARTHGQAASPTTMGKEMLVFAERLSGQIHQLKQIRIEGKFGGATGNFNAHLVAYPDIDWRAFSDAFLQEGLGLKRQSVTTQIEHYDQLAAFLQNVIRINTILVDFCRDMWTYVSMDYFKQKTKEGEVGSSAMPHKVNPIDFENAEGNLGIANALADHLALKLPVSRLQRDLTDSTVLRNLGQPFAYLLISLQSIEKGIGKLELNEAKLSADLEANHAVLAEAIQSVLRSIGYPNPYETLKALTRGKSGIDAESLRAFIDTLEIDNETRERLHALTPFTYIGYAANPYANHG